MASRATIVALEAAQGAATSRARASRAGAGAARARAVLARAAVLALVVALAAVACSPAPPPSGPPTQGPPGPPASGGPASSDSPGPSASPPAAWIRGVVDQPAELVNGNPSPPAFCSPCRSITQTYLVGLAAAPTYLLAVGSVIPLAAAAWTSPDGHRWVRDGSFPGPDGSQAEAVATDGRRWVAVGRDAGGAATFTSPVNAPAWSLIRLPGNGGGNAMAVIALGSGGFVAGGFVVGDFLGDGPAPRPAIWRSPDGVAWAGPELAPGTGLVSGLAEGPGGIVAVGRRSLADDAVGEAWFSPDGGAWSAAPRTADLDRGAISAVAERAGTWTAVGRTIAEGQAMSWQSTDGLTWVAAPPHPDVSNFNLRVVMTGIAATADGFVAVGWKSDAGNGSAVVWRSADGRSWRRDPDEPIFSGGGMSGVATQGRSLVAIGTTGWPDSHIATGWFSAP